MSVEDQVARSDAAPVTKRVAVIFAHPDDAEFTCAGTIAKWVDEGHEITYVVITNGDKGSDDRDLPPEQLVALREEEQRAACAILGVRDVIFMGYPDGMLVPDLNLRRDIVRLIRRLEPDVVICGDPTVYWHGSEYINHPDHRAAAQAVFDAIYPAAGNHRFFPELLAEGLEPHKVKELYVGPSSQADTWIDITATMDRKLAALRAHAGQMGEWDPEEAIRGWNAQDAKHLDPPGEYAEDFKYFKLGWE